MVRISLDLVKFQVSEVLKERSYSCQLLGLWMFNALYAIAGVSFWRGVWFLLKIDVGIEPFKLLAILLGGLLVLILNEIPGSLISSPLALSNDDFAQLSARTTFLQEAPQSSTSYWFIFDILFTNVITRQLVVFCWWSLWSLENKFFFYQNIDEQSPMISYDSLIVGYAGLLFSTAIDICVLKFTSEHSTTRKVLSIIVTMLAFFACVNVWRGIWSFLNVYFLPSLELDTNYIVGHLAGILSLSGLFLSSTIASDAIVVEAYNGVVCVNYWRQ